MSTRAKKSDRSTPAPLSGGGGTHGGPSSSTPIPNPNIRPSSPLSPTRHNRLHEKAELQSLNDRLAIYIDRVRYLENENSRLTLEVSTARDCVTKEVTNIKSMYEHELSDVRKLLDETASEKARLEIDTKRLWEECDDLKARVDKLSKELMVAENSARIYESRCSELSSKYNNACNERKKAQDEAKEAEKEIDRLKKQLAELRKQLENETLCRVKLENTLQSLKEELSFKDQIHSQEITETRTRRQVEISEIDGRLSEQYEAKLQQSLQELRDQYESQMRANRDEIEHLYENKIKNLQNAADRNSNAASSAIEELRMTRSKIDLLSSKISELEATNAVLNARINDLEKILDVERSRHADNVAMLEAELARLREEMEQQIQEYQDLMDIKVSLDLEIAAYDKLLTAEESRLNITSNSSGGGGKISQYRSSSSLGTPRSKNLKRKRTMIDESEDCNLSEYQITSSAKGDVEISEADSAGRYVKLHNKGAKEISVGGWQIVRKIDTTEVSFKLHRSVKIDAGGYVTVWSSDSGVTHEPPSNIVMKQQKWFVGDTMKTMLFNAEGEEVAASERSKQQLSSHASRHRSSGGYMGSGGGDEELYHQQVRGGNTNSNSSSVGRSFWLW